MCIKGVFMLTLNSIIKMLHYELIGNTYAPREDKSLIQPILERTVRKINPP